MPTATPASSPSLAAPRIFLCSALWSGSHLLHQVTLTTQLPQGQFASCTCPPGTLVSSLTAHGEPWQEPWWPSTFLRHWKTTSHVLWFSSVFVLMEETSHSSFHPQTNNSKPFLACVVLKQIKKVLSDAKQSSLVCLSQQPKTIAVSTHLEAIPTLSGVTL